MAAYLRALLPTASRHAPVALLTNAEATAAVAAIAGRADVVKVKTPLADAMQMLVDPATVRKSQKVFEECANAFRAELSLFNDANVMRRLAVHESLMAAGYYARAANMHNPKLDPVRFVVNHYNFAARRDSALVAAARLAVMSPDERGEGGEAEALVAELLHVERYLFGAHRLRPVEGRQYLVLGVPLREFADEKMLKAALELPVVKVHGNFGLEITSDVRASYKGHTTRSTAMVDRWQVAIVSCQPELDGVIPTSVAAGAAAAADASAAAGAAAPAVTTAASTSLTTTVSAAAPALVFTSALMESSNQSWLGRQYTYDLRFLLPAPILPFWERVKLKLLDIWVYFFCGWFVFWLFDEEFFAIVGILVTRYHTAQVLKEEAKRTGGRYYIMRTKFS